MDVGTKDERPGVHNLVADSTTAHEGHGHGHGHRHYHSHMNEVILPMRTGLHAWEVPYGLRLAGITTGYRQGGTYMDCMKTLFTMHNQTLNSWTMIFGWACSCWLLWWTVTRLQPEGWDLFAFWSLWLCPTIHLPFTVGYHQFAGMSPAILRRWRALDVVFIFVASIPLTWGLAYFVMPPAAAAALTAVTVGLALHAWHNAAALPAGADIDKKANTRYVGLVVLVYTFPIVLRGAQDLAATYLVGDGIWPAVAAALGVDPLYGAKCVLAVAFCFVYGGAVYTASFPDVFAPGVFDLVGSAQQLMHLAIAGAHVIEWLFAIHMYQRRLLMPRS
ncbi:hypothetical protein HYH02_011609 [Chlamydomonas schloesseri]|uniref:Uncharacterized protein n=1 Tax=Chlamydomonas schloesseri TaxID=2026947 RepID=A0A835T4V0_9CHLO|nr:hypothetical protein HYH02_011609 [Chlamydomonas schloesseri]|eukprot:KAG2436098.1 hypothetical protein HYH02_011609 [Chlamydomonas schloesseri]